METALLFVHLLAALGLVGLVLMQRSEGGALGLGGGGGGLMTGRGAADVLARATTVLAAIFFLTSLSLTLLAQTHRKQKSVIETAPVTAPVKPAAPAPEPVRAAPLENYTPPVEGGVVVPAPGQGAERAAPLPIAPPPSAATGAAPAATAPALRPATLAAEAARPAPAAARPAPATSRPAASQAPAESVQTSPSAPAPTQPRTRAGPDE